MSRLTYLLRVRRADALAVCVVVAVAVPAVAVNVLTPGRTGSAAWRSTTGTRPLPSCSDVSLKQARVSCRTKRAVLQLVRAGHPVVLSDVQGRVLRMDARARHLAIRLRLRNTTTRPRQFNEAGRQVYLALRGQRIEADSVPGKHLLAPGQGQTATLRFDVGRRISEMAVGTADLGLLPYAEIGRDKPRQIGVIRLQLPAH